MNSSPDYRPTPYRYEEHLAPRPQSQVQDSWDEWEDEDVYTPIDDNVQLVPRVSELYAGNSEPPGRQNPDKNPVKQSINRLSKASINRFSRLKSRKRQKFQNEQAGIKLITDMESLRKGQDRREGYHVDGASSMGFVDAAALRAIASSSAQEDGNQIPHIAPRDSQSSADTIEIHIEMSHQDLYGTKKGAKSIMGDSLVGVSSQNTPEVSPYPPIYHPSQQSATMYLSPSQQKSVWSPDTPDTMTTFDHTPASATSVFSISQNNRGSDTQEATRETEHTVSAGQTQFHMPFKNLAERTSCYPISIFDRYGPDSPYIHIDDNPVPAMTSSANDHVQNLEEEKVKPVKPHLTVENPGDFQGFFHDKNEATYWLDHLSESPVPKQQSVPTAFPAEVRNSHVQDMPLIPVIHNQPLSRAVSHKAVPEIMVTPTYETIDTTEFNWWKEGGTSEKQLLDQEQLQSQEQRHLPQSSQEYDPYAAREPATTRLASSNSSLASSNKVLRVNTSSRMPLASATMASSDRPLVSREVNTANTANTSNIANKLNTVNTVNTANTAKTVSTANTSNTIAATNTTNTSNTINTENTINTKVNTNAMATTATTNIVNFNTSYTFQNGSIVDEKFPLTHSPPAMRKQARYQAVFPPGHPMEQRRPQSPGIISPGFAGGLSPRGGVTMTEIPLTPATGDHRSTPFGRGGVFHAGPDAAAIHIHKKKKWESERRRQRYEKEDRVSRKLGNFWRGRGCIPAKGCFGRNGREGRFRRRMWLLLILVLIMLIAGSLLAGLLINREKTPFFEQPGSQPEPHPEPEPQPQPQSIWVNVTNFPPMPTGVLTVVGPNNDISYDGCTEPSTLWSCSLPKEQQNEVLPFRGTQPTVTLNIQYDNNTNESWRTSWDNSTDASAVVSSFSPAPQPPSTEEMAFLGTYTDDVKAGDKAGEPTPFYISMLDMNDNATRIGSSENSGTVVNPTRNISLPLPESKSDGSTATARLFPRLWQQPVRLFDRGLSTEHYGFYAYFRRTIYVQSLEVINSTTGSGTDDTVDGNGGALITDANYLITWGQTRVKVALWTSLGNSSSLLAATSGTESEGSANRPGTLPYPATIRLDTHGGNPNDKLVWAWAVSNSKVDTSKTYFIANDIGKDGLVDNPRGDGDAALGGFDGGVGGCRCQWQNFV
ncbi:hypothetical protein Cpir12675_003708 [Ceratocystis pirilliformis]|uniref:Glycoprotease family protein n=1 Tax=Ceratocystis pirilliformis TaxID=259994 RepID=A0ABR3Z294_9PEZI